MTTIHAEIAEKTMEIAARVSRESYLAMKEIYENGREELLIYRMSGTEGDNKSDPVIT